MSQTISAIASLLWPLIVLAVLVLFRGPLASLVRSTASRDFTIKIAGQEVSVGELHRQQMDMMTDLHNQVAALQKEVDGIRGATPAPTATTAATPAGTATKDTAATMAAGGGTTTTTATAVATRVATAEPRPTETELTDVDTDDDTNATVAMVKAPWERLDLSHDEPDDDDHQHDTPKSPPNIALTVVQAPASAIDHPEWTVQRPDTRPKPAGVLWVDDNPGHNALQLDQLERRGVVVDIARSTKEAVQKLTGQRYEIIVSDMERVEDGTPVPNAGLELIRTVRTFDRDTPVVIYTKRPGGRILTDTATQIGADLVTSSWYELSQELHRVGVV